MKWQREEVVGFLKSQGIPVSGGKVALADLRSLVVVVSADSIAEEMTVADLIAMLQKHPPETKIFWNVDTNYLSTFNTAIFEKVVDEDTKEKLLVLDLSGAYCPYEVVNTKTVKKIG